MEPISIILTALASGAVLVANKAAEKAAEKAIDIVVPDLYKRLKDLIKYRFETQGKSDLVILLDKYEQKPEKTKSLLEDELKEIGAGDDQEIIKLAQKLLEELKPQEASEGKFNIHISGGTVKGFTQQNTGTINQTFN